MLGWFKDSLTVVWARIQMVLGVILSVVAAVDMSPIIPPRWLPLWLIASGVITEFCRRRTLS